MTVHRLPGQHLIRARGNHYSVIDGNSGSSGQRNGLKRPVILTTGLAVGAFFLLAGCGKEDIKVYTVPKEEKPRQTAAAASSGQSRPSNVSWQTPEGWTEQASSSGIRAGTFTVSEGEQQAEISVVPLAGATGIENESVNLWRRQLGLEPLEEGALQATRQEFPVGGQHAHLYDFTNDENNDRLIGAVATKGNTTWFFKMTGKDPLLATQKGDFKQFLASVEFGEQQAPMPTGQQQVASPPVDSGSSSSAANRPAWDVPEGWQQEAAGRMRVASFSATEKGAEADISVSSFPGKAGGVLPNINRWRGQLQLSPVDAEALNELITSLDLKDGEAKLVDMASADGQKRMLAAIVPRATETWFFKMTGQNAVVGSQKDAFVNFVKSVRYSNE